MEFPLNQLKIDPEYIRSAEEGAENAVLAHYTGFQRTSAALVKSFQRELDNHGTIKDIPIDILRSYHKPLSALIDDYKNLPQELQRGVNKNTKDLKEVHEQGNSGTLIDDILNRKRDKLKVRMEYIKSIQLLAAAIESLINGESLE
jgi:hypothetical protein